MIRYYTSGKVIVVWLHAEHCGAFVFEILMFTCCICTSAIMTNSTDMHEHLRVVNRCPKKLYNQRNSDVDAFFP